MALPPRIIPGTIINDRYEVEKRIGAGGMGEVYKAFDSSTKQPVALKLVPAEEQMAGDEELLRQEVLLAQKARHPNVCFVYDLAPSPWGPIIVMEYIPGQTLHDHIRMRRHRGGFTADEFRKIATDVCRGLAAIHKQDLIHGDLKPGNVMVAPDRSVILDFGFAKERARAAARKPGTPPDGGTSQYMSPERLKYGGASPEDDVYALALTLWEMWTSRVPETGHNPRTRPMKEQIQIDVPALLTTDEIRQIFQGLSKDPDMRPQARHIQFFSPPHISTSPVRIPRKSIDPGPQLSRDKKLKFVPGAQSLLITYATNAAQSVGALLPLLEKEITLGRRQGQKLCLPEATVSGAHATMQWQSGSWLVEDNNSTNGTFAHSSFDRKTQLQLFHGQEIQMGECRMMLVSFQPESSQHQRARHYLSRHDGLTRLLHREYLMKAIDEDGLFAEWSEAPMQIARFDLGGPKRQSTGPPTIVELLALRRAAQQTVGQMESLLLSLTPLVAGRVGALQFVVNVVGPSLQETQNIIDDVAGQVRAGLPPGLDLRTTLRKFEPGRPAHTLVD